MSTTPYKSLSTDQVAAVVCGYKEGGTTFFSSLLTAVPEIVSRFECGLLLAPTPDKIPNLRDKVLHNLIENWKLPTSAISKFAACDNFGQVYHLLVQLSPLELKNARLVDKFPGYASCFDRVLAAYDGPVFFMARDPRAVYWSRLKQHGAVNGNSQGEQGPIWLEQVLIKPSQFAREYCEIYEHVQRAVANHGDRIHIFRLEDIVTRLQQQRERLFKILQIPVPEQAFGDVGVSEHKVRRGVDESVLIEYRKNLSGDLQREILDRCAAIAAAFIYEDA